MRGTTVVMLFRMANHLHRCRSVKEQQPRNSSGPDAGVGAIPGLVSRKMPNSGCGTLGCAVVRIRSRAGFRPEVPVALWPTPFCVADLTSRHGTLYRVRRGR